MPENSILRGTSVLVVMLVAGLVWYGIDLTRLKRAGVEEAKAKAKAGERARVCSLIAGFLYMLSMVSIASLFL